MRTKLRPLSSQVVVITGASSGIGRSTARHFARRGAAVVLTARRAGSLEELAREIEARGGTALAVPGDVTSKSDLQRVCRSAMASFGRIDTWINNAGVFLQGRVQDIELDEYRRLLDVNLVGVINGTQCALEVMLPQQYGLIIQVSSVAARRGIPYTSAYTASKAGIAAFTESLRAELWGSGVRFSILYPPPVDTPIWHTARAKLGVIPKPAPPVADPGDAAAAIEWLARTAARERYFGSAGPLSALNQLFPFAADWLVHRGSPFLFTSDPATGEDGLDTPVANREATERHGWRAIGFRGFTLAETVRVLPVEMCLAGGAAGYIAARALVAVRRSLRRKN